MAADGLAFEDESGLDELGGVGHQHATRVAVATHGGAGRTAGGAKQREPSVSSCEQVPLLPSTGIDPPRPGWSTSGGPANSESNPGSPTETAAGGEGDKRFFFIEATIKRTVGPGRLLANQEMP